MMQVVKLVVSLTLSVKLIWLTDSYFDCAGNETVTVFIESVLLRYSILPTLTFCFEIKLKSSKISCEYDGSTYKLLVSNSHLVHK